MGRTAELLALDDVLDGLGACVIEGGPACGKTALWRYAVEQAHERGHRVLTCRPDEPERALNFAGLTDLFEDEEFGPLPAPQRQALEVALLRAVPDGGPPEQRAVNVAALGLVRLLATKGPVLLAVDDAQWLDPASAGVLGYVARRAPERGVGWVVAGRGRIPFGLDRSRRTRRLALAAEPRLTGREVAVLMLLADGLTAGAIAHRLGGSHRTVHKHLENVYRKLGTSDRLSTVLRVQRLGLLPGAGATGIGRSDQPLTR